VDRTLIEHWDGTAWSVIPSPNIGPATDVPTQTGLKPESDNWLAGIAAISPGNIWTVGGVSLRALAPGGQYYGPFHNYPLAEHWDGTQWSLRPPVPAPGSTAGNADGVFSAVSAAPPDDVIAIDLTSSTTPGSVWQFSGSAWSPIVPALAKSKFAPYAVTIPAPDDTWILGGSSNPNNSANQAAHWNGQQWQYSTLPGAYGGPIFAAAAAGANDIWASDSGDDLLHYTC
jgi:hypothetical protein